MALSPALFHGTVFSEAVRTQLYNEMMEIANFFPEMKPYRVELPDSQSMVVLQGSLGFVFGSEDVMLPLSISFPMDYPEKPPQCLIPVAHADRCLLTVSELLSADGLVNIGRILFWDYRPACEKTLACILDALSRSFSTTPPFEKGNIALVLESIAKARHKRPPSQTAPPRQTHGQAQGRMRTSTGHDKPVMKDSEYIQDAIIETDSLITFVTSKLHRYTMQAIEVAVTSDLRNIVSELVENFLERVEHREMALNEAEAKDDVEVDTLEVDNTMIEVECNEAAMEETIKGLRRAFGMGAMSIDELIPSVRKIRREYFAQTFAHTMTV